MSSVFDPIYNALPGPLGMAVVRGIRALVTIVAVAVVAGVSDGTIFANIHFIPSGELPLIEAIATPLVLSFDKWLREKGLENPDLPTSSAVGGPPPPEPVSPVTP